MARLRKLSPPAREAARLLGQQVRLGRRERRWTVQDLAERVGVTEVTVRKVERGDPTVALGTAFEAAALVGVPLYDDSRRRELEVERVAGRLAVLPAAVRRRASIDDDF